MSGKPAARVTDPTACPLPGHGTNPITAGSPNVLFDNLPAARLNDPTACGSNLASNLATTVKINGLDAATVGTLGNHGNSVVAGSGTVIIGNSHTPAPFIAPEPLAVKGFDIRIQLLDQATGTPLKNLPYIATLEDGSEVHDMTDENGMSRLLGNKATPQTIALSVKPNWLLRGE